MDVDAGASPRPRPPSPPGSSARAVLRRRRTPDRNRTLEVLSGLIFYLVVVHYALKFAAFLVSDPDDVPSREEMLRLRGAVGVLGFSTRAPLSSLSRKGPTFENIGAHPLRSPHSRTSRCENRCKCKQDGALASKSDHNGRISFELYSTLKEDSTHVAKDQSSKRTEIDSEPYTKSRTHTRPRIPILSYRDDYVVVSKPAGMAMHHNSHSRRGQSKFPVLQSAVRRQLSRKPYLVHRLDQRTSGAVALAFDSRTAAKLHGRLRGGNAVKLYLALVRGDLRERFKLAGALSSNEEFDLSVNGNGSVIGKHGRAPLVQVEENPQALAKSLGSELNGKISVTSPIRINGVEKEARTDFYFLSSMAAFGDGNDSAKGLSENNNSPQTPYMTKSLTLLLCRPRTGRTHQIRRHVRKAFSAPVIGDSEHGDSKVNRFWRTAIGFDRLGLHCWYLGLPPPPPSALCNHEDKEIVTESTEVMAPLTADFAKALRHEKLQPLWEEATAAEPRLKMDTYDERGGTFGRNYRKQKHRVL